jgi:Pyridine nucleotide-disulphide oxidoreductase
MTQTQYDLVILGSGSTAFAAALRAQELSKTAVMIEERTTGGTCVNRGCLPSKNLIEAAKIIHEARYPRYPGLTPAEIRLGPEAHRAEGRNHPRLSLKEIREPDRRPSSILNGMRENGWVPVRAQEQSIRTPSIGWEAKTLGAKRRISSSEIATVPGTLLVELLFSAVLMLVDLVSWFCEPQQRGEALGAAGVFSTFGFGRKSTLGIFFESKAKR